MGAYNIQGLAVGTVENKQILLSWHSLVNEEANAEIAVMKEETQIS